MKHTLFLFLAAVGFFTLACSHGAELEGQSTITSKLIGTAVKNGAYNCAPKELAQAKTHYEFSQDEASQGKYHEAKRLLLIADNAANEAIRKSPPEKCAKRLVVVKVKIPEKVVLKVSKLDTDGDGILDVNDKCPKEPEDKDGFEDEDGCPDPDNDGDGIPDAKDKCPGTDKDKANNFKDTKEDKDGFEDDDGCPDPDNDKDGIPDVKDKCPNEPETKNGYKDEDGCPDELKLIKVTVKKIELKQKIFFAYNRAKIKPKSFALLNEIAALLKARQTMTLRIEGHTDNRGGRSYNKRLSRKRARAVRKYLIAKGIDPSRMKAEGYGLTKPIADNKNSKGRAKNRRVEFVITHQ
ncbi:OmpA family protein [Myxococcota bacterium]|nr:OmpA family protein [Myxococcota bacterium]MBU1537395.1 OmpA family protein [Myxococcota bacterium]